MGGQKKSGSLGKLDISVVRKCVGWDLGGICGYMGCLEAPTKRVMDHAQHDSYAEGGDMLFNFDYVY